MLPNFDDLKDMSIDEINQLEFPEDQKKVITNLIVLNKMLSENIGPMTPDLDELKKLSREEIIEVVSKYWEYNKKHFGMKASKESMINSYLATLGLETIQSSTNEGHLTQAR